MSRSCIPANDIAKMHDRIACLIGRVSERLMADQCTLGTAESCTGGLVAAHCTAVSGSSAWFLGGVVAYANTVKEQLLGVSPVILAEEGAVSKAVVEAMATGVLQALSVQVAVAVSGIAGPTGGTPEKPVGTVWIAAAKHTTGKVKSQCFYFSGSREDIRLQAVEQALSLVLAVMD